MPKKPLEMNRVGGRFTFEAPALGVVVVPESLLLRWNRDVRVSKDTIADSALTSASLSYAAPDGRRGELLWRRTQEGVDQLVRADLEAASAALLECRTVEDVAIVFAGILARGADRPPAPIAESVEITSADVGTMPAPLGPGS